jgi:hypothetical protein
MDQQAGQVCCLSHFSNLQLKSVPFDQVLPPERITLTLSLFYTFYQFVFLGTSPLRYSFFFGALYVLATLPALLFRVLFGTLPKWYTLDRLSI